jgi:anti-anti-sigma regulatory factor
MNEAPPRTTRFPAFSNGDLAIVRVAGPGICRESGRFENLMLQVEALDFSTLVIDFADCARVDSTFAGTLLRLASRAEKRAAEGKPLRVVISGAKEQVAELLDALCLDQVFELAELPDTAPLAELTGIEDRDLSRDEIMSISIDGHEKLSQLSPANAERFATLLAMLRRELENSRKQAS